MDTTNTEINPAALDPHYWDALEPATAPDIDPDLAVQLEIDAHDLGTSRGLRFRLAELQAEAEAFEASLSPCGIHMHRWPVARCLRCHVEAVCRFAA